MDLGTRDDLVLAKRVFLRDGPAQGREGLQIQVSKCEMTRTKRQEAEQPGFSGIYASVPTDNNGSASSGRQEKKHSSPSPPHLEREVHVLLK